MGNYHVIFVRVDGLDETEVGPSYGIAAINRDEAVTEALELPRPEGANFIKLINEGRYEPPKIGFAL